jgi:ribosomal protein L3
LTAFLGYKAGMTHIVRDVEKPGSSEFLTILCLISMNRSVGETGVTAVFCFTCII